ncbi:hypothetical protein HNQ99_002969 [Rhizorhapis suberifaciens]|uniref:Uncharacterized protein n=1 Tax=Rhizorhapis suberifaciens TaxID=13656 RepID=A0A840HXC8_9SPHN|nr:hypothetical protein [Rhizorhapis suberifaciens]
MISIAFFLLMNQTQANAAKESESFLNEGSMA